MSAFDASRYGRVLRGEYDDLYPEGEDSAAAADLLIELAGRDRPSLLEFGIGTGRLALRVQRLGVVVAGIEGSPDMIQQLRDKPGGQLPEVIVGDYLEARMEKLFSVVLLAFNGIFDPRGVEAQLGIFRNAAAHLRPGGKFVVESWVMHDVDRSGEWTARPRFVGEDHVEMQLSRFDLSRNRIERVLVHLRESGTRFIRVSDTYAGPAELDLMAHVTGFTRIERWAGWRREPFGASSVRQVSVFELLR